MKKMNRLRTEHLSVMIAFIAVVLSQFPPIYDFFKKPELSSLTSNEVHIAASPAVGITFDKMISITNTGNKAGWIKKIDIVIENSKGDVVDHLTADRYRHPIVESFGDPIVYPWNEILLKPENSWAKIVFFTKPIANGTLTNLNRLSKKIQKEEEKWEEEWGDVDDARVRLDIDMPEFEISDVLFAEIEKIAKENIRWLQPGTYRVTEYYRTEHNDFVKIYELKVTKKFSEYFLKSLTTFRGGLRSNLLFFRSKLTLVKEGAPSEKIRKHIYSI